MNSTVDLIMKLKEVVIPLAERVSIDHFDYQRIQNENRHLSNKNLELIKMNDELEKLNDEKVKQGAKILADAQAEADNIIKIANENLVVTQKERELAKRDREKAKQELDMALLKAEDIKA